MWPFSLFQRKPDPQALDAEVRKQVDDLLLQAKLNLKRNSRNDPALIDEMFWQLFPSKFKAPGPDPMVLTDVQEAEPEDNRLD